MTRRTKTWMKLIAGLAGAAALALWLAIRLAPSSLDPNSAPFGGPSETKQERRHNSGALAVPEKDQAGECQVVTTPSRGVLALASSILRQGASWNVEEGESSAFRLLQSERATENDSFESEEWIYIASFAIDDVGFFGLNDYLVAGATRDGEQVIERWRFIPVTGGWVVEGGMHSPIVPGTFVVKGYGAFLPLSQREQRPIVQRDELFRGSLSGPIDGVVGYPGGHILLILVKDSEGGTGTVYRLDTLTDGEPFAILSERDLLLLPWMDEIHIEHFVDSDDIAIVFISQSSIDTGAGLYPVRQVVVLEDAGRDGVIDEIMMFNDIEDKYVYYGQQLVSASDLW